MYKIKKKVYTVLANILAIILCSTLLSFLFCFLTDFRFIPNSGTPQLSILIDKKDNPYVLIEYQSSSPIAFHYAYFYSLEIKNNKIILGEWSRCGLYNPFVKSFPNNVPYRIIPLLDKGEYEVYNGEEMLGYLIMKEKHIEWCACPGTVLNPSNKSVRAHQ